MIGEVGIRRWAMKFYIMNVRVFVLLKQQCQRRRKTTKKTLRVGGSQGGQTDYGKMSPSFHQKAHISVSLSCCPYPEGHAVVGRHVVVRLGTTGGFSI